eukprot:scaffold2624_cov282-Prasinococcus_capsulatus_cf.AAC.2
MGCRLPVCLSHSGHTSIWTARRRLHNDAAGRYADDGRAKARPPLSLPPSLSRSCVLRMRRPVAPAARALACRPRLGRRGSSR